MSKYNIQFTAENQQRLGITDTSDDVAVGNAIVAVLSKNQTLTTDLATANGKVTQLETELTNLKNAGNKEKVTAMIDQALEDKKITVAVSKRLATDYETNPVGLKELLEGMGAYTSVTETIQAHVKTSSDASAYAGKSWDDIMDMGKMDDFKKNHPAAYKEAYKTEFGEYPA